VPSESAPFDLVLTVAKPDLVDLGKIDQTVELPSVPVTENGNAAVEDGEELGVQVPQVLVAALVEQERVDAERQI
jgi:hypothetical protein